jgi:hypothetical protein
MTAVAAPGKPAADAAQLADWFGDIARLWSLLYFDGSTSTAHRDAAILEVLSCNAKIVLASPVDARGDLYKPLTLTLVAACRRLGIIPTARHWVAAIRNVREVRGRTAPAAGEQLGLPIGTAASLFKELFGEALVEAGVTDRPTILTEANRRASLGLAVNWGLRFLLAYAHEIRPGRTSRHRPHDLRWVRSLIGP